MPAPVEEERVIATSTPFTLALLGMARPNPFTTRMSAASFGESDTVANCPLREVAFPRSLQALVLVAVSTTVGARGPVETTGKQTTLAEATEVATAEPLLFVPVTS